MLMFVLENLSSTHLSLEEGTGGLLLVWSGDGAMVLCTVNTYLLCSSLCAYFLDKELYTLSSHFKKC